ncbi:MAG: methyltransferase domain-containing protein [Parafilimonas sp.]
MRFQSYFNTSLLIIQKYLGNIPLSHYLKHYFSENKKHGAKDRKYITHLCYCYYRLGYALKELNVDDRLKVTLFLCNNQAAEWRALFNDEWLNNWYDDLQKRIQFIQAIYPAFNVKDIFPWQDELSETIDATEFAQSHLIQPNLFLRVRPNKLNQVKQKLADNKIPFEQWGENCLALPNTTKIDSLLDINKEAVIQDYSSQQVQEFFAIIKSSILNLQSKISILDCCAGSGGKSILTYDVFGSNIELTVTDIRSSIIQNLQKRFREAGIKNYHAFAADITSSQSSANNILTESCGQLPTSNYNLIICDAPCTGSGTWTRTPEQLYFFTPNKIEHYTSLQKKIISNVIPQLEQGGYFLYITCSVFKKENEDMVDFIQKNLPAGKAGFHLQLLKMELLKGYNLKADTMFAALFTPLSH